MPQKNAKIAKCKEVVDKKSPIRMYSRSSYLLSFSNFSLKIGGSLFSFLPMKIKGEQNPFFSLDFPLFRFASQKVTFSHYHTTKQSRGKKGKGSYSEEIKVLLGFFARK